jgi:hypothetical protein
MSIKRFIEDKNYRERVRREYEYVILTSPDIPPEYKSPKYIREFFDEFLTNAVPRLASIDPFATAKLTAISDYEDIKKAKKNAYLTYLVATGRLSKYGVTKSPYTRAMKVKSFQAWFKKIVNVLSELKDKNQDKQKGNEIYT